MDCLVGRPRDPREDDCEVDLTRTSKIDQEGFAYSTDSLLLVSMSVEYPLSLVLGLCAIWYSSGKNVLFDFSEKKKQKSGCWNILLKHHHWMQSSLNLKNRRCEIGIL